MENRKEYIDLMANKLKEWDDEILKLENEAKSAKGKVKIEMQKQIDEMNLVKIEAKQKFKEIEEVGQDSWEDIKAGAEITFDALDNYVKKVWDIIKS